MAGWLECRTVGYWADENVWPPMLYCQRRPRSESQKIAVGRESHRRSHRLLGPSTPQRVADHHHGRPPSSGKTMLAKRMPTILPQLGRRNRSRLRGFIVASVNSWQGSHCWRRRPFPSPHHTISDAGLVGGGSPPSPGDISKAQQRYLVLR